MVFERIVGCLKLCEFLGLVVEKFMYKWTIGSQKLSVLVSEVVVVVVVVVVAGHPLRLLQGLRRVKAHRSRLRPKAGRCGR